MSSPVRLVRASDLIERYPPMEVTLLRAVKLDKLGLRQRLYPAFSRKFIQLQTIEEKDTGNQVSKQPILREKFAEVANNELTYYEICNAIDQIAEANIGKCFLSGGEIFTRKELPEIIEYLAKRRIYISGIFTNATIYRPEVFEALKQTGMKTTFLVSLDGGNLETHDFIRGKILLIKPFCLLKEQLNPVFM